MKEFNLQEATAQEVFDKAVEHLLKQNCKSENEWGNCLYRDPNGLKCAAGPFIPDSIYNPEMEGKGWYTLTNIYSELKSQNDELIFQLQRIHDNDEPEVWVDELANLADEYNLNFNKQDEKTN